MERMILRRLILVSPTLLAVVTIAFVLMRAAPGGPFDLERPLDPAAMENLKRVFRLDEPLWRQYLDYLAALAHRVLPVLILAAPQVAAIARLARAAMIEALASSASRTMRAYGLKRRTI